MIKDFNFSEKNFIDKGDYILVEHWREGETEPSLTETMTREQFNQYKEVLKELKTSELKKRLQLIDDFANCFFELIPFSNYHENSMEDIRDGQLAAIIETGINEFMTLIKKEKPEKQIDIIESIEAGTKSYQYHPLRKKNNPEVIKFIGCRLNEKKLQIQRALKENTGLNLFENQLRKYGFFELGKVSSLTQGQQRELISSMYGMNGEQRTVYLIHLEFFFADPLLEKTDTEKYKIVGEIINYKSIKTIQTRCNNHKKYPKIKNTKDLIIKDLHRIKEK